MESFRDNFGITLGSLLNHFGIILESFWVHVGIMLASRRGDFGIILMFGKPLSGFGGTRKTFLGTPGPGAQYAFLLKVLSPRLAKVAVVIRHADHPRKVPDPSEIKTFQKFPRLPVPSAFKNGHLN